MYIARAHVERAKCHCNILPSVLALIIKHLQKTIKLFWKFF
jgi:hypothetical protein